MASVPSPGPSSVDSDLDILYERRTLVDHLIETLERYAEMTGTPVARRPPAKLLFVAKREAR